MKYQYIIHIIALSEIHRITGLPATSSLTTSSPTTLSPITTDPTYTTIFTMRMEIEGSGQGLQIYSFHETTLEDDSDCTDPHCENVRYESNDPADYDVYLYRDVYRTEEAWEVATKSTNGDPVYQWNLAECFRGENQLCLCDGQPGSGHREWLEHYRSDLVTTWQVFMTCPVNSKVETEQNDKRLFHKSGWWIYGLMALVFVGTASVVAKWIRSMRINKLTKEFQVSTAPIDQDVLKGLSGTDIESYGHKSDAVKLMVHTEGNESQEDDQRENGS